MLPGLRTTLARSLAVASSLLLAGSLAAGPAQAAVTEDEERADRVSTTLDWGSCSSVEAEGMGVKCATVDLPLDYDDPEGPNVAVFVAKHTATDPDRRIGSLFVNPGGPGGPGSAMAIHAAEFLSPEILARFDIIGMDPRGIGASTNVVCGTSTKKQQQDMRGVGSGIPVTPDQRAAFLVSAKKQALNCSSHGAPLSASMSTAEVARDMDVLRRLVGDDQLTYLGFSYGSYLGQVYANMFPDRVRALAIDGVLDPVAWAGTPDTADEPVTLRLASAEGAHGALQRGFQLCAAAGPERCLTGEDPQRAFDDVAERLKAAPVTIEHPDLGAVTIDYGTFIGTVLQVLYAPNAPELVDLVVASYAQIIEPATPPAAAFAVKAEVDSAVQRVADKLPPHTMEGYEFWQPTDAFLSVLCTDSVNTAAPQDWAPAIAARAENAPHFADAWGWASAPCADRFWSATDEDAWRGAFSAETSAPVLVVGNTYDPSTSYQGAVAASELLPNSALLTVEAFGHTAYGMQRCATETIDAYLLEGTVPEDRTCEAEYEPFTGAPVFG